MITLLVYPPIIFMDLGSSREGKNLLLLLDFKVSFSIGGSCFVLLFDGTFEICLLLSLGGSFGSPIVFSDRNFLLLILKEVWVEF